MIEDQEEQHEGIESFCSVGSCIAIDEALEEDLEDQTIKCRESRVPMDLPGVQEFPHTALLGPSHKLSMGNPALTKQSISLVHLQSRVVSVTGR